MTPQHAWTLLDSRGRIRGTCQAPTFRDAAGILCFTDDLVVRGWTLAMDPGSPARGPEPGQLDDHQPETSPAARDTSPAHQTI